MQLGLMYRRREKSLSSFNPVTFYLEDVLVFFVCWFIWPFNMIYVHSEIFTQF